MSDFNGLGMNMGNLSRLSKAKSRSISAENFTGEKGKGGMSTDGPAARCARDLGQGWKVSPYVVIKPGDTFTAAEIDGPGAIQSMWFTGRFSRNESTSRFTILRVFYDGQEQPSVECPLADFFCRGWGPFAQLNSLPVQVNPGSALTCCWEMPFRKSCRMTVENRSEEDVICFYQINYTLTDVPDDAAYFHAQFRRVNPLPYKEVHTIVDGIKGAGHFVGTHLLWGVNNNGWWGEGEIKFYIDGDEWPTICGTGLEDYFLGSYDWNVDGSYRTYSTPVAGMYQVVKPEGNEKLSQMRFAMYRWHIPDPVRFEKDLRVTIQALGWRSGHRYLPLQDDIASVAFWYQTLPTPAFPELPDRDYLEVV